MTFQETLQLHLSAIQQRDLPTFVNTITRSNPFCCILPNGKRIDDPAEFIDFTQSWFADPDWQISFTVEKTIETSEMSIALLAVHYDDKDEKGASYQLDYYLTLGFVLETDGWRLIFDQNTIRKI